MTDFFETTIKNYSGLSSETKPTIAAGDNVPNGSRWREIDTGRKYHFNLSDDTWYLKANIQYPVITDGDSIYVKDIDTANSDNGGFSGVVTDYFDSLKSVNLDASATNPKTIKIWFNRSTQTNSIGFGCDNLTKSFSNIKIKALGSGEEVRYTKDLSTDSTKRNSYLVQLPPLALNGVLIEFHTTDEIGLSNLIIFKSIDVMARLQAQKDDGTIINITSTDSGNLRTSDAESGLAIAKGDVVNTSFIHKFGDAPDFDITDGFVTVWDGANDAGINQMQYVYSTSAIIDSLSSSNDGDTQDIEVLGLDSSYATITQTITLTGQTRKALDTNLIRVFRARNVSNTDLAGDVYCYENTALTLGVPNDTTKVRAVIIVGNNQTLMAVYTIPAGKIGYMRDWYASTSGAKQDSSHIIKLSARPFGQVFQLKHKSSIAAIGTSYIHHKYKEPEIFTEKSDIEMMTNTDANIAGVSAGFDIVLVDS